MAAGGGVTPHRTAAGKWWEMSGTQGLINRWLSVVQKLCHSRVTSGVYAVVCVCVDGGVGSKSVRRPFSEKIRKMIGLQVKNKFN